MGMGLGAAVGRHLVTSAASLLGVAVAAWHGRRFGWSIERGWSLLAISWLLWAVAVLVWLAQHMYGTDEVFPAQAGVFYLLSMLPLLMAIGLVGLERHDPLLRTIDGSLLLTLGVLYCGVRLEMFGPELGSVDPVWLADLQNGVLVLLAVLRRAAAENDDERRLFGVLAPFLLVRLVTTAVFNRLFPIDVANADTWVRLLPSLPYLLVLLIAPARRLPRVWPGAQRLAPFARAASPLALSVLLLAVSALIVARGGLMIGLAGIVIGVFGYGLRSTVLLVRTENEAQSLYREARSDPLTGIPNRRGFDEAAVLAWRSAAAAREPVAVLMVDIDDFKAVNDRYGHPG